MKTIPGNWCLDNEAAQRNSKKYIGVISQSNERSYTLHPVYALEKKDGKDGQYAIWV
jgi:hypothetical protein